MDDTPLTIVKTKLSLDLMISELKEFEFLFSRLSFKTNFYQNSIKKTSNEIAIDLIQISTVLNFL